MNRKQQADMNNRSRQLNSHDARFWQSRGVPAPPAGAGTAPPAPVPPQTIPTSAIEGGGKK
jgi:hypothetical protein